MPDSSSNDKVLEEIRGFLGDGENQAVNDLSATGSVDGVHVGGGPGAPGSSLARGLSYYTGAIMEITVPDLAGSLGGGGRYDNLIGTFLGATCRRAASSLGLERILVVMDERRMFPDTVAGRNADVMVTLWNDDSQADALALAASLRSHGLRVDVYPEADKLGKQFKYASSRGIPLVTVVGDDEKAAGTVTVKDLRSGEHRRFERSMCQIM